MKEEDLATYAENTWCPGCGNFGILSSFKEAIIELVNEGMRKENFVVVTGIGCHGKMFDYINLNGFYSLHGRPIATATGIKLANPKLNVVVFAGDGDTYAEGISHFIHAARRNIDITLLVHNNQVFALTTGQATPTSEVGFTGKSTPEGNPENPINPIELALISGATFVARAFALDTEHLKWIIKEAIKHKGFSFIDILQPCISFHNFSQFIREHSYKLEESGYDASKLEEAIKRVREWDYNFEEGSKIPLGIFYKVRKETFEEKLEIKEPFYKIERKVEIEDLIKDFESY